MSKQKPTYRLVSEYQQNAQLAKTFYPDRNSELEPQLIPKVSG